MLVNFGVSYRGTSLATLDAITLGDPARFYAILKSVGGIRGVIILQTCNRVEFFLEVEDLAEVVDKVLWHWTLETRFKLRELARVVERRQGDDVVKHLVSLGSGLESMLVGEPQILGQVKDALAEARVQGAVSPLLSMLFEKAIKAAARIRKETGIGRGTVSIGSAAVKLAEEALGPIRKARVLLIGTGQVGMLAMKTLKARQVENVTVAGRTLRRTESFCRTYGGRPTDLSRVHDSLTSVDLVLVATKSRDYLVTKEMLAPALEIRGNSRLIVLDLSTPRNVSPEVQELQQVTLKTMEDLREIAEEGLARRQTLVKQAEPLVKQRADEILKLLRRENANQSVSSDELPAVVGNTFGRNEQTSFPLYA